MYSNKQISKTDVPAKRVDIVSVKLVREGSCTFKSRFINNPADAVSLVEPFLADCDREKVIVLCLDTKAQPTAISTCSVGTVNSSLIHPRELFKESILCNAASVILAHNHPSGIPTPSEDDISITKRLSEAGKVLGIDVIDHVIIGSNGNYKSFKELGLL